MPDFTIRNPDFATRVYESFSRQGFMATLNARLTDVGAGHAEIEVPYDVGLSQQHGFFHGGLVGTIADNSAGYAAFSLLAVNDSVLTVEYKLNLMAPALGDLIIARGQVVRSGRRMTIAKSDIYVRRDGIESHCATMLGTFMTMPDTPDEPSGG